MSPTAKRGSRFSEGFLTPARLVRPVLWPLLPPLPPVQLRAAPPGSDVARADAGGEPGGRATMEMEPPIGTLQLLSLSRADKKGRAFGVTIPASDKVTLLFKASQLGKSVGTVTISTGGGTRIVLVDVQIASIQMNGSTVQMRLDSSKPAEISLKSDQ